MDRKKHCRAKNKSLNGSAARLDGGDGDVYDDDDDDADDEDVVVVVY